MEFVHYYPGKRPTKKSRRLFYEEQLSRLQEDVSKLEVGSDEWVAGMQNIATLENQMANGEHHMEAKDVIGAIGTFGTLCASFLGLGLTYETAKMSYVSDEEMKMKNGNVWKCKDDYRNYYKTK